MIFSRWEGRGRGVASRLLVTEEERELGRDATIEELLFF